MLFGRVLGSRDEGAQHDHHDYNRDTNNEYDNDNIYNTRRGTIYEKQQYLEKSTMIIVKCVLDGVESVKTEMQ